jgi:hypothetical protein
LLLFFQAEIMLEKRKKEGNKMPERQHATWGELLQEAVEKPGRVLEAYTAVHNFSFGNALLALEQCIRRNLQPGPLYTYNGWLERKRQVRKGEKGITLCMLWLPKTPSDLKTQGFRSFVRSWWLR